MNTRINTKDLIGKRFGRLIVLDYCGMGTNSNTRWLCKCDCGNQKIISRHHLMDGNTQSCGCYKYELTKTTVTDHIKHHKYNTRLYKIWCGMKSRCQNNNNRGYLVYGGNGVTVCNEWQSNFMNFYDWAMTNSYSDELSIDRIEVNGNYEPSNCRWATDLEQANNKRKTLWITYKGEKRSLPEWSRLLGINKSMLYQRITKLNWTIEDAFLRRI